MITLINRTEILNSNKIISSVISELQHAIYNEELLQYDQENNEELIDLEVFDNLNSAQSNYHSFNKILSLGYTDIETFTDKLTEKLTELLTILNVKELIIISHLKLDFFGNRKNSFKPLKKAYEKLEKIVNSDSYNEAFKIDLNDLSDFVEILFWLERCDPSVAEFIFLFDIDEQIQLNICKYGNIHFTEFNGEKLNKHVLKELGWIVLNGEEFDNFSNDGVIKDRLTEL